MTARTALLALLVAFGATGAVAQAPPRIERDCAQCPEMAVLPAGRVVASDGRVLSVDAPFAIARFETTRAEFLAVYKRGPGSPFALGCRVRWAGDTPTDSLQATLATADFPETERHPAVCVSWEEAAAYAEALSRLTGRRYALPTATQWEYAARAGATGPAPWRDPADACGIANLLDRAAQAEHDRAQRWRMGVHLADPFPCDDGEARTAPVGRSAANAFGLHDMLGNAAEWTQQCGLGGCVRRIARGGSWNDRVGGTGFAMEQPFRADERDTTVGFRLVRLD